MKLTFGQHTIDVGNEDKILFPDAGITKATFVEYHAKAGQHILRYVEGRPVSMKRHPDGIEGEGFFQKEASEHFPDWIERATVRKENGVVHHVVIRRVADLVYLADQACIEPHTWLATTEDLDRPDRMVFDLDPSNGDIGMIRAAARGVRETLEELDLVSFVMTSGSRGYHVWVPLRVEDDFDAVRDFARGVAEVVVSRDPDTFTIEQRKDRRGDRVLIDYLRNAYAQTSIPPYTVRARPGAPVATPLEWDELSRIEPQSYTIANVLRRLAQKDDPWAALGRHARSLAEPRRRLAELRRAA